jgi:hypothetical protein
MTFGINYSFCFCRIFIGLLLCCTQAVYSQEQSLPAVVDATYYRIEIRIDTLQKKTFGRVDIDLTLCSYPAERIALDLTDAAVVDSVYVNGFPAGHLQRNGKLIVAIGGRYNHIRKISVRCVYAVPFTENGKKNGGPVMTFRRIKPIRRTSWSPRPVP